MQIQGGGQTGRYLKKRSKHRKISGPPQAALYSVHVVLRFPE